MIKRGMNKVLQKKDYSNTVVALFLIATILCSIAGTLIVLESLSSLGKTEQLIKSDPSETVTVLSVAGEPKIIPVEPATSQGKISLNIKKQK